MKLAEIMSESKSQKNLPPTRLSLLGQLNLHAMQKDTDTEAYEFTCAGIGNDDRVHFLLTKKDPAGRSMEYLALSVTVCWHSGSVYSWATTEFGRLPMHIHYIQALHDGFLLLGARSRYLPKGQAEHNAFFTGPDGKILRTCCLGDGISQCLVDQRQRIITGYFDEGVFGNYGWRDPLGACGLIVWSDQGEPIWKNNAHDICDCYALNIDSAENLWFSYYTEFYLVETNYQTERIFEPGIDGCEGFLFNVRKDQLLLQAGYDRRCEFLIKTIDATTTNMVDAGPAVFAFEGSDIQVDDFYFRSSKALIWETEKSLYFTEWHKNIADK